MFYLQYTFLEAHLHTYRYEYCVNPVSKMPTKPFLCRTPIYRRTL